MSLDGAYDHDNVFAKILRGEIPSARVFEDEHVCAFMDAFPQARGHTLVIPKASHARNLLDEEPEKLSQVILGVQRIARAVRAALNPDGVMIFQTNGAPAGQTVFHLHFHVLPRWARDAPLGAHGAGRMADLDELKAVAAQIAAKIS